MGKPKLPPRNAVASAQERLSPRLDRPDDFSGSQRQLRHDVRTDGPMKGDPLRVETSIEVTVNNYHCCLPMLNLHVTIRFAFLRLLLSPQPEVSRGRSYGAVSAPPSAAGERASQATCPILEDVWNVSNGVAVRHQVPSSCAVPVVVQPSAEDQIRRQRHEQARASASASCPMGQAKGPDSHQDKPCKEAP